MKLTRRRIKKKTSRVKRRKVRRKTKNRRKSFRRKKTKGRRRRRSRGGALELLSSVFGQNQKRRKAEAAVAEATAAVAAANKAAVEAERKLDVCNTNLNTAKLANENRNRRREELARIKREVDDNRKKAISDGGDKLYQEYDRLRAEIKNVNQKKMRDQAEAEAKSEYIDSSQEEYYTDIIDIYEQSQKKILEEKLPLIFLVKKNITDILDREGRSSYELLNLNIGATRAKINQSYRNLVRYVHPDKAVGLHDDLSDEDKKNMQKAFDIVTAAKDELLGR